MTQEFNQREAIRRAVQTEKELMEFYLRAAAATKDPGGRKVFETLAQEEREHARNFFHIYSGADLGSFDEFIGTPANNESVMMHQLEKHH